MHIAAQPLPQSRLAAAEITQVHLRCGLHPRNPTQILITVLQGRVPKWCSAMGGFGQSLSGGVCYSTRLLSSVGDWRQQEASLRGSYLASGGPRSWLITGGVGALGLLTASWLQSQAPAASLLLCSRSGRSTVASDGLQELMLRSCCITISR